MYIEKFNDIFKSINNDTFVLKYSDKEFIINEDVTLHWNLLVLLWKCKKVIFKKEVRITSCSILWEKKLYYDIDVGIDFWNIIFKQNCTF